MRRAIPLLFICIAGLLGMTGCSADAYGEGPDNSSGMIMASTSSVFLPTVETKAPYSQTSPSVGSPLQARVLASQTSGSYADWHANGTMTFTGTGKTPYDEEDFLGNNYYELDGSLLYFTALYPASIWTFAADDSISYTFTGKEDVMFALQDSSSITQAEEGPEFTFNHLLTRLNITLVSEDEAMLSSWGEITDLALVNTPNKVTVSLGETDVETMTPVYAGDTIVNAHLITNDTPVSNYSTGIPIALESDEPDPQAYILAAPVIAGDGNEYTLQVKTSNGSVRNIPLDLKTEDAVFTGSTRSRSFDVTLRFQANRITVEVASADDITITGWTTSLVLQTIMFTSNDSIDRVNMLFGLKVLNAINANSYSHQYTYFGLYGVNDVTHNMEFDVTSPALVERLTSFKKGQHVMFDLKKLIRTWGTDDNNIPYQIVLKNYADNWELAPAKQTINTLKYPAIDWEAWEAIEGNQKVVDGITSATLSATNEFPLKAGGTTSIQPSDTLTNKGSFIIKRK